MTSLTTIGFGNIAPTTDGEKIFSVAMMMVGSLLYATIFGNVTTIFQQMYANTNRYHEMLNNVRDFLKLYQVPKGLSERVMDYIVSTWSMSKGIDTEKVLSICPKDMRADICVHLNRKLSAKLVIFRKIADVKREEERQKSEVALSIPEDHPVRKLFQRFKQQRDSQTFDQNCVQVEPEHHQHYDSFSQCQSVSSQQQECNRKSSAGRGSISNGCSVVMHLQTVTDAGKSELNCTQETVESKSRLSAEVEICHKSSSGACAEGAAGGVTKSSGSRGVRGWAKFKSAISAEPSLPDAEQEKRAQKTEEWPHAAMQPSEESAAPEKNQEPEENGQTGGNTAGEAGEETSILHKTDSCDSGITKSDLRIDRAGDSRSSFERSPMEKSPLERSLFEHSLGVYTEVCMRQSFLQPVSEQSLLQAALHEAKLELKGDIRKLSSRLSLLESHVSEILRLLSMKRRLSLPPTPTKPRIRRHDSISATRRVAPKAEEETFDFAQD
uniref:Potassium voltage-gated channel, subfamily H (Eag-related), member 5a n=1 Tax=Nothobranchius kadleci TaxID=1051664 RepID=A0A1A8CVP2_NOTKA